MREDSEVEKNFFFFFWGGGGGLLKLDMLRHAERSIFRND